MKENKRILIVDGSRDITNIFVEGLSVMSGYAPKCIDIAHTEKKAKELLATNMYDLVTTGMTMENPKSGLEIAKRAAPVPVFLISGNVCLLEAPDYQFFDLISNKPFKLEVLIQRIIEEIGY